MQHNIFLKFIEIHFFPYNTDVSLYNTDVSLYNTDVSLYNTDVSLYNTDVSLYDTDVSLLRNNLNVTFVVNHKFLSMAPSSP